MLIQGGREPFKLVEYQPRNSSTSGRK